MLSLAVFFDRKWGHIPVNVLPSVWELELIALEENARMTCLPQHFNLTSHILFYSFQTTVINPWNRALMVSLSRNASVFMLEVLIVLAFKMQYVTCGNN